MHHATALADDRAARIDVELTPTPAEAIADLMQERARDGQPTTRQDLLDAGFSSLDIDQHGSAAVAMARSRVGRRVDDDLSEVDRAEALAARRARRVGHGAAIVAALFPSVLAIHQALRHGGFTAREVGELWPDILATAGDRFAELTLRTKS